MSRLFGDGTFGDGTFGAASALALLTSSIPLPVVVVLLTIGETTHYFSDIEYGDNGTNWHDARIVGDIAYSRSGNCMLWGQRRNTGAGLGNIELLNTDGALDTLCTEQQFDASVSVYVVDQDQTMSAAVQIAAAPVLRIEAQGEQTVRIVTGSVVDLLDRPLQPSLYETGDGVAMLIGRPRPVAIGKPLSCPIVLVNDVDYTYDVHDSNFFGIVTVRDSGFPLNVGTLPSEGYKIADPPIHGIELLQQPVGRIVADIDAASAVGVPIIAAAEGDFATDLTDWTVTTLATGAGTASATWVSGAAELIADKLTDGPFDGVAAYAKLQFPATLVLGQRYDWSLSVDATMSGTAGYALVQVFFEPDSGAPGKFVTLYLTYATGATTPSGTFTAPADGKLSITCGAAYGAACTALIDAVRLDGVTSGGHVADIVEQLFARAGLGVDLFSADALADLEAARPWAASYWADGAERIANVVQSALDSVYGWSYVDASGDIAVGYLVPPEFGFAVIEITESELAGEIEIEPDLAPGLSSTVAGARNWYKYGEGELADALADADRALLTADYRVRKTSTYAVGIELGPRDGLEVSELSKSGIPTLLDDEADIQAAADYLAMLYPASTPRRFYKIPCFLNVTQAATLAPGDKVRLTYDRFGCDAGRALRVVSIEGRAGDDLVILRCWGSAVNAGSTGSLLIGATDALLTSASGDKLLIG